MRPTRAGDRPHSALTQRWALREMPSALPRSCFVWACCGPVTLTRKPATTEADGGRGGSGCRAARGSHAAGASSGLLSCFWLPSAAGRVCAHSHCAHCAHPPRTGSRRERGFVFSCFRHGPGDPEAVSAGFGVWILTAGRVGRMPCSAGPCDPRVAPERRGPRGPRQLSSCTTTICWTTWDITLWRQTVTLGTWS